MAEIPLGMYGLQVVGLPEAVNEFLVPVEATAPAVEVELVLACSRVDTDHFDDGTVVLAYARGSRHEVHRYPPRATISVTNPTNPAMVAQPLLVIMAAAMNRWRGALTLHGGAFAVDGRAWAVVADKFGGKSTTMAGLAERGVPVLTDDLVVIHDGDVLPGPRGVDLRLGTVEHLGLGYQIGVVAGQPRYRMAIPEPPVRAPLAGIVSLVWSEGDVRVERMNVEERLRCVADNEALGLMGPQPPELLFQAISVPMYTVSRPRSWEVHERVISELLALASAGQAAGS